MFFGLPLRTTSDTTEVNGMPLVASAFQSLSTLLALTRRVMSGSTEKLTMSAGFAVDDAARLVARRAVGRRHRDALAVGGGRERRDDLAPARLGHGVSDEVSVVAAAGVELPPATSLAPPPQPASRVASTAKSPERRA